MGGGPCGGKNEGGYFYLPERLHSAWVSTENFEGRSLNSAPQGFWREGAVSGNR